MPCTSASGSLAFVPTKFHDAGIQKNCVTWNTYFSRLQFAEDTAMLFLYHYEDGQLKNCLPQSFGSLPLSTLTFVIRIMEVT